MENLKAHAHIQLDIERMRHSICSYVNLNEKELDSKVEEAIKQALRDFDYNGQIRLSVESMIKSAISEAVGAALYQIRYSDEFKDKVSKLVNEYLALTK